MKQRKDTTARGVYYDLDKSPYIYEDDLGNVYRFSSEKKLDMFISRLRMSEEKYMKEVKKLKLLGYDINQSYFSNMKQLPKIVYNAMLYK